MSSLAVQAALVVKGLDAPFFTMPRTKSGSFRDVLRDVCVNGLVLVVFAVVISFVTVMVAVSHVV